MSIRKKLSAAALASGLLLAGVAVATPADAVGPVPNGTYCGPLMVIANGGMSLKVCIVIDNGAVQAYADVSSLGTLNNITASHMLINAGGAVGVGPDCQLASNSVFNDVPCYGPPVRAIGMAEAEIELWVNGTAYTLTSPVENVG